MAGCLDGCHELMNYIRSWLYSFPVRVSHKGEFYLTGF